MWLLKCPNQETLLSWMTISGELPARERVAAKCHIFFCQSCQTQTESIRKTWNHYFKPEPDITSSLLRVYSNLKDDETLIIKGWKLDQRQNRKRSLSHLMFKEGWLYRGAISTGFAGLVLFFGYTSLRPNTPAAVGVPVANRTSNNEAQFMQIRVQEKDRVKVHYIQPELLQTVEFETTSY